MKRPFADSHLNIGELIFTHDAVVVRTILGSCVAVCMHHAGLKFSAICHAIYPGDGEIGDTRYAGECARVMIHRFKMEGALPRETTIKVFGGSTTMRWSADGINARSTHMLESILEPFIDAGYVIASANTGGESSRELYFNTETGDVFLRSYSGSSL